MKGFRRCWVRRASLARAIIGCCEPVQADTVWRARLIRARAAEVVGPVWTRGASAVRFWLGLGWADAGCCGSVFVLSPRVTHASWRLAALRFVTWPLLFATWICRLSRFVCVLCCALPAGTQRVSSPLYFPDRLLLCVFVEIVSRFRLFWQRIAVVNDLKEV